VGKEFAVAVQRTIKATHDIVIKVAKREHAKVMATAPRPTTFTRFVDGRKGAAEESVKKNGVILYQYPRLDIVAQFALETLRRLSPVGPPVRGHYRDSHTLFLNGASVSSIKNYKTGDQVIISNPMPYARKIEVGAMKMKVPGHVYQRATGIVRGKYGQLARIEFTYRGMGRNTRHPAMIISER
jgi:ribosomal protein L21E